MEPQTLFLTTLPAAILALIAALGIARWSWRPDIPPFGINRKIWEILWNPDRYAKAGVLPWIRFLAFAGAWLLAAALGALLFQFVNPAP